MSADGEQGGVTQALILAVVRKALDQCQGIESGPNGQGGMRVVVHFKGGGDEYPLFSLLNAALAKHATSPEDAA